MTPHARETQHVVPCLYYEAGDAPLDFLTQTSGLEVLLRAPGDEAASLRSAER